jgi:Fibronectin type III domain
VNAIGPSAWSTSSPPVTPLSVPTKPRPPRMVAATPGNGEAVVTWHAGHDGGEPITSYRVSYSSDAGATWTRAMMCTGAGTSCTVTGLQDGTSYVFEVTATNAVGRSDPSRWSRAIVPVGPPDAPVALAVKADRGSIAASWLAPFDNGEPITGYTASFSSDGGATWTPAPSCSAVASTSCTITGLANGTAYLVEVSATNAQGPGPASDPAGPATPAAVPGPPLEVVATAGNSTGVVSWTAPGFDGGVRLTGFRIEYSTDGGATWTLDPTRCTPLATRCIVSRLDNGTAYAFRVAATNAVGSSAWSSPSATVVPSTTPSAPSAVRAKAASSGQVALSWNPPATDRGLALLGYSIERSSDAGRTWSAPLTTGSASTSLTVSGLDDGTSYVFRVAASNADGTSAYSSPSQSATPRSLATTGAALGALGSLGGVLGLLGMASLVGRSLRRRRHPA